MKVELITLIAWFIRHIVKTIKKEADNGSK
jgi:hypothetical protein